MLQCRAAVCCVWVWVLAFCPSRDIGYIGQFKGKEKGIKEGKKERKKETSVKRGKNKRE